MRRPDGYVTITGDPMRGQANFIDLATGEAHTESEVDTVSCGHCQGVFHVKPRADPRSLGGGCRLCERIICPRCVDRMWAGGKCTPHEEMIARMEAKQEARRSYGF